MGDLAVRSNGYAWLLREPIRQLCLAVLLMGVSWQGTVWAVSDVELQKAAQTIHQLRREGELHEAAQSAWQVLNQASPAQLPVVLATLAPQAPLSNNWIRAAVDSVAERALAGGGALPAAELEKFILQRDHAPMARRLAYEWLIQVDSSAEARLIPQMLDDPSLELRRDAVAQLLTAASQLAESADKAGAQEKFQRALSAGRDKDQVETAAAGLEKLGVPVNLPAHFGFVTKWQLIGPFDNRNKIGFDAEYDPEKQIALQVPLQGKDGIVQWKEHATEDKFGMVDLNAAIGKNMGAVGYAYAVFHASQAQQVDVRLGCINANKVWVNGKLIISNHVYHSGTAMDQYVAQADLQPGENTILVKVCQNEQTDSWAQDWQFQLRICDSIGTAILSQPKIQ